MIRFQVDSWAAIAPGLTTQNDWIEWLSNPHSLGLVLETVPLKQFPPMIRRRFGSLGKCAMAAALQVLSEHDEMPSVFASRHGDAELTLRLLQDIGAENDMSPTGFSLAVHNAVSGLYSIARKDTSSVTSIAAVDGLIVQALIESLGQLQNAEKVLCVIYDLPLPELFETYRDYRFPYAIAVVIGRQKDESYCTLSLNSNVTNVIKSDEFHNPTLDFIRFLSGKETQFNAALNGANWALNNKDG